MKKILKFQLDRSRMLITYIVNFIPHSILAFRKTKITSRHYLPTNMFMNIFCRYIKVDRGKNYKFYQLWFINTCFFYCQLPRCFKQTKCFKQSCYFLAKLLFQQTHSCRGPCCIIIETSLLSCNRICLQTSLVVRDLI